MAKERTSPQSCVEHTLEINNLKKDMETVLRHEKKFNDSIDNLELMMGDIKTSILMLKNSIEKNNDTPDRLRKLEDKSIFIDVLNKIAWIGIGALIAVMINQNFDAVREKREYNVERTK